MLKRFLSGLVALLLFYSPAVAGSVSLLGAGKAGGVSTQFVGKLQYNTSSSRQAMMPAGAAVGDLVFIHAVAVGSATIPGGWTTVSQSWISTGFTNATYWKFIDATDISAGVGPINSYNVTVVDYRLSGGTTVSTRSTNEDFGGGTTISGTGWTPGGAGGMDKLAVCFVADRSATNIGIIAPATNSTTRANFNDAGNNFSDTTGDVIPYVGGTMTFGSAVSANGRLLACFSAN